MSFWQLNRKKFILQCLLSLLGSFSIAWLMLLYAEMPIMDSLFDLTIIGSLFFLICFLSLFLSGTQAFSGTRRILSSDFEYSVVQLFDNGYTLELENSGSMLKFTRPVICARISGYPVKVYFVPGSHSESGSSPSSVIFCFYPLRHWTSDKAITRQLSVTMINTKNEAGIRPKSLQFVADLKAKGYTVSE